MNKSTKNYPLALQCFDRHIVIPDLHGEDELAQRVVDIYFKAEDICFIFLGDLIDKNKNTGNKKGVFNTLELIKSLGNRAIITIANHEWSAMGALYDTDSVRREAHEWSDLNFYGTGSTLASYGIDAESDTAFKDFKDIFEKLGHSALLLNATPYYETDKFIATHAGVSLDWDWEEQKHYLQMVSREMSAGTYELQPENWFSTELACNIKPVNATNKIVLSGHAHYLTSSPMNYAYGIKTSPDRVINDGKRIRLASRLNNSNDPLFIWQDWDEKVINIHRN